MADNQVEDGGQQAQIILMDKTSTGQKVFRGIVFIGHAAASIALLVLLYTSQRDRCNRNLHWYTSNANIMHYAASNSSGLHVEPITTGNGLLDMVCSVEGPNGKCQQMTPNVMAIEFDSTSWHLGGSVNVIALMCIFEYITASFALVYFAKSFRVVTIMRYSGEQFLNVALMVAGFWNLAFTFLLFIKSPVLPASHTFLFGALGSIIASFVQYRFTRKIKFGELKGFKNAKLDKYNTSESGKFAYDKNEFLIRYAEYAITAPMVFIASLIILTLSGVTATSLQLSFVSMSVCNLLGIVVHELYEADSENTHYNMEMLFALGASWYAWACAWVPFFFPFAKLMNALNGIPDTSARDMVIAVIAMMIFFYCLFGIIPTFLVYSAPFFKPLFNKDTEGDGNDKNEDEKKVKDNRKYFYGPTYMRVWIFDTLSLSIKLLVVGIVSSSDIFQPRRGC